VGGSIPPASTNFSLYCQVLADSAFSRGHFGIFGECSISRRHSATKCGKTKKRDCTCPIWVTGRCTARKCGKRSASGIWEAAQKIVRDWEARIEDGYVTVKEAFDRFIAAPVANKKSEATMVKYRLLEREMVKEFGSRSLDTLRVHEWTSIG